MDTLSIKNYIDIFVCLLLALVLNLLIDNSLIRLLSLLFISIITLYVVKDVIRKYILFFAGLCIYFLLVISSLPVIKIVRTVFSGPFIPDEKIVGHAHYFGYPYHFEALLFTGYILMSFVVGTLFRLLLKRKN